MSIAITKRVLFTRAFQSQSFTLLWSGQTISAFGNGAFIIALVWEVLLLTGSTTAMSIVIIAQTLPILLFLLLNESLLIAPCNG